jgi:hypothetical protein
MMANACSSRWQNDLPLGRTKCVSLFIARAPHKGPCDGRLMTNISRPCLTPSTGPQKRPHAEGSVVQNNIEERLMNPDATVVFNEAEFAKTIHEEADAGPGGADHFGQSFLCDLRN